MNIRPFVSNDTEEVVALWEICDLTRPWNNPLLDIQRKLTTQSELFLIGTIENTIIASVMAGYEGHRGWINYLAVLPEYRGKGLGAEIMKVAEAKLIALGCPKINLQIRAENEKAIQFYRQIGFTKDNVISMGKRLIEDKPLKITVSE